MDTHFRPGGYRRVSYFAFFLVVLNFGQSREWQNHGGASGASLGFLVQVALSADLAESTKELATLMGRAADTLKGVTASARSTKTNMFFIRRRRYGGARLRPLTGYSPAARIMRD